MSMRLYLTLALCSVGCETSPSPSTSASGKSGSPAASDHKPTPAHIDEPAHAQLSKVVRLSRQVVERSGIKTASVARELLPVTVALPGEIVADPDRCARISVPVAGRLAQIHFQEGCFVKKGEVLALLSVPDLGQLRSSHASSLTRAKAARANVERLKDLSAQRLASEQAYLDAQATADALDLEARATEQQLSAIGAGAGKGAPSQLALRAPIAGTVVSRDAVLGQPVTADQSIGQIVDLSEVWFLGRVFEKDLSSLKQDANAEVQLNAFPQQRFAGTVEYIGRQVDPIARTLTARIRLKNATDLLSVGLFGIALVSTNQQLDRPSMLVVPRSALGEIAGKTVVFVRHADGDFELHEVMLGDSAASKVQIVSGLREGEQVVVEGLFTLKSSMLKSTFAEEE